MTITGQNMFRVGVVDDDTFSVPQAGCETIIFPSLQSATFFRKGNNFVVTPMDLARYSSDDLVQR